MTTPVRTGWLLGTVLAVGLGACLGLAGAGERSGAAIPVPLYDAQSPREPNLVQETAEALVTHVGDRVRDRHAREAEFQAYDHFLPLYWQVRTVGIEVVDKVAKGGTEITFRITSLAPLIDPNLRLFFEGQGTVAQYAHNTLATELDPLHYTATIGFNSNERRPLRIGDRIEFEFSPFLKPPVEGRKNYYGTAFLYVVGQGGMVPWEGRGPRLDSHPLPAQALLGGGLTLHRQYSDEPRELFKQLGTNVSPASSQQFMLGRRLHHTDFGTGVHSESGNPVHRELAGTLGVHHVARSCVACHVNNSRSLPPAIGAAPAGSLVRIARNAAGNPHAQLGATLQSQSLQGLPEAQLVLAGWEESVGTCTDGTPYSLRRPTYRFIGVVPPFSAVRSAPPLVGQGLLEAISEETVAALAASNGGRMRVVTDPETGAARLGRFGWKGSQARLRHQIAGALKNDMGVVTHIHPLLDQGDLQDPRQPGRMLREAELENLVRYVATLGIPPRRALEDPRALRGESLFEKAKCAGCHVPTLTTGPNHPLAELRNQTIRPYTDLLLHDLGPGLAEAMAEGDAQPGEWRTAPLWGLGLTAQTAGGEAYLHDGRARTLAEAILWHGGQAEAAREAFRSMTAEDREALLEFLQSL